MKKRVIFSVAVFLSSCLVGLFLSEWFYELSLRSIHRFVSFVISVTIVLSFFVSVILLLKSFRDFARKKLGSKIRLRLVVLFLTVSIISTFILSSIFVLIIDSLKTISVSEEGKRISQISKELLKGVSEYYKETFNNLEASLEGKLVNGVEVETVGYSGVVYWNEVVSNIIEHVKLLEMSKGRSIIVVNGDEVAFVFEKSDRIRVAYAKVDKNVYDIKRNVSKILQLSSISEFVFYEVFEKYLVVFLVLVNIPSLFVSILVAYLFSEYISRGISKLSEGMAEVSKGNLGVSVSDKGGVDEIKDLIREFNKMTFKLLEAKYRVSKIEKMELWKDIARKVAHEIKNPLTPIKLSLQRILLSVDAQDFKERVLSSLSTVLEEIDRIDNLVTQLSNFAKIPQPNITTFKFSTLVERVKELFSNQDVEIEVIINGDDSVCADFDQMKQCLINLVKNGIEASQDTPKKITIKFTKTQDSAVISVRDYGSGIPEDLRDKILNPYITTKKTGSGLGLSIVETIVINHGGKLYFESEVGKGSEFFIELPVASQK